MFGLPQFGQIISAVQSNGISANVPITPDNLKTVYVYRRPDGYFIVQFTLSQ